MSANDENEVLEILEEKEEEDESDSGTFDLIRKVEMHSFIYNSRDPKHSKRDVITQAWDEIATGLKVKGKPVNGNVCKKKWKTLRDYYYKVKKGVKGKSGDGAKDKKRWTYFSAMDRVLSSYLEENENTQSNFPGDDSNGIENQTPIPPNNTSSNDIESKENDRGSKESTPTGSSSNRKSLKRLSDAKSDANEKLLNEKIMKVLEEPEEVKDQYYHFGMTICNKLRSFPPQMADYAMFRLSSMLYEIMYPIWDNSTNYPASNESTHNNENTNNE